MTLRRKTILIIGATLIGLLLILFAVSQGIILNSFSRLEVKDTSQDVERAQGALSDDISSLVTMTRDWAAWDDTYNFIENGNEEYIKANPTDATFEGLRVNVMLFINSSGQIVFSKAFDLQNEEEVPVPESLAENLSTSNLLTYHADAESQVSGLLLLPEGPMLIASQPILTSQNEGPIRGALIMGRYLDSAEIGRVAEITHLSLTVQRLDEPQMPSDFKAAHSSLSEKAPIFIRPLDKNSVAGYSLLNDVYGEPVLMLRVDMPREIYQQGQASQLYFIVAILGVGLVFGVVVLLLLGKSVLSPLSRLSAAVSSIGKTGALSARVSATGKDELSNLAGEINRMLDSLERSHDELQESEEKFKHLVEDMNDGYFVVQNFRIVFANARSAEMFGHSVEEVTGRTVGELLPPEIAIGLSEWHTRRLRGEVVPQQYEATLTRDDGTTVTVEFGAKRMYYAGKPAVSVVVRDITKRRQMEEALRESEEKYRDVIDRASDLITIVQDTIIKYVNPRSLDLLGYQPKEIIGTPITEHIHPDDLQQVISRYQRRMSGEHVESIYETALLRKDGSAVEVEMNAGVITYGGRPADLVIVRDITERKKMETALRESEEHYSALVGSLSDAVFKIKGQVITWCNDRVEGIYGYTKDELIGKKSSFLFPTDVNPGEFIGRISAAIKERGFFRSSGKVKRKDGSVADIEYTISQIPGKEPIELVSIARDATERKRMEEELLRLSDAVRMTSDSIVIIDLKGKIVEVNEAALKMHGPNNRAELIGKDAFDFISPEERKIVIADARKAMSAGDSTPIEYHCITKDGRKILVEATVSVMKGRTGEPIGFVNVVRDITQRKQMEKALQQSEERFRNVLDNSLDMIYSLNLLTGKYEYVSPASGKIFGYSPEEFIALGADELVSLVHPDDAEELNQNILDLIMQEENRVCSVEYRVKHKELGYRWVNDNRSVVYDEGNIPVAVVGILRDITERKLALEALRLSEERFRSVLENSHDMIYSLNLQTGKYEYVSPASERILGYSPEEVIRRSLEETRTMIHPEDIQKMDENVIELIASKGDTAPRVQYRVKHKKLGYRWVSDSRSVVYDNGHTPVAVVGSMRDITERKEADDKLNRTMAELARSNTDLERFAYVASHDLQEPLRMVASYTQLLARRYKGKLDADADEFIGYAVDGATRMQQLINALLDYSRVGTRGKPLAPTNCEEALNQALANLQAAIKENDAVVTHDDLPTVVADATQMVQLFQNLIGNAIKFHSEKNPEVRVEAERNGTEWIFSVRDNGIGIDPQYFDRIFLIFQRLHGRGEYPGTGIGLAICKKIIERHKGRIWVESQSGKGATFYFTIPIKGEEKS